MNIRDSKVWSSFVYQLLYPAILGSMLYDIFTWTIIDWAYFAKLLIIIIYCLDYLHLYHDLLEEGVKNTSGMELAIDGMAAFSFKASFIAINMSEPVASISILCVITLVFGIYNYRRNTEDLYPYLGAFLWLLVSIVVLLYTDSKIQLFTLSVGLLVIAYAFYVFHIFEKASLKSS